MLLLDHFKESGAAYPLLTNYTGKMGKYVKPTDEVNQTVKDLTNALAVYEAHPCNINTDKIIALMDKLDITATRVTSLNDPKISKDTPPGLEISEKDNILFFHPKDKGKAKGTGQVTFFWRFGAEVIPGQESTYSNPIKPFILSSMHEGTDGAGYIALCEFINLKAKALVLNGLHRRASTLKSPFQAERTITDAPHSPDTLGIPFLVQALRTNFPNFALIVVHGLGSKEPDGSPRRMKLWFITSVSGAYDLTKRNWAALLAIAFAQKDFNFGEVTIKHRFPGYYITDSKGVKRNIAPQGAYDGTTVYDYVGGPTSDVQMHVVNSADSLRSAGKDSGRGVHIEHGQQYRTYGPKVSTQFTHLLEAMNLASEWYTKWDDKLHKFADMPKDFRQFPKWFNDKLKPAPTVTTTTATAAPKALTFTQTTAKAAETAPAVAAVKKLANK